MKNIIIMILCGIAVATAWSACNPPAGHPTSCSSIGVTPGSGGWIGSIGDEYAWSCCNQNFTCVLSGVNYGYRFQKVVAGYGNGVGHCFDYGNITNVYPTTPECCITWIEEEVDDPPTD